MIINEFIQEFEKYFPINLAYKWDNVGLQIGSEKDKITSILVSLDLTTEVVNEAINNNSNLIVVHHPIIFSPIKSIDTDTYFGKLLKKIIKNNINIYVAHTNFDLSNHGMNKLLADILELENQKVIEFETPQEGLGRYGVLRNEILLKDFIKVVKSVFKVDNLQLIGSTDLNKTISNVAITGGSGSSLLTNQVLEKCDVYITGDVTYHHALDALNKGLTVLDVGHNIEKNGLPGLIDIITEFTTNITIRLSQVDTNPYKKV